MDGRPDLPAKYPEDSQEEEDLHMRGLADGFNLFLAECMFYVCVINKR